VDSLGRSREPLYNEFPASVAEDEWDLKLVDSVSHLLQQPSRDPFADFHCLAVLSSSSTALSKIFLRVDPAEKSTAFMDRGSWSVWWSHNGQDTLLTVLLGIAAAATSLIPTYGARRIIERDPTLSYPMQEESVLKVIRKSIEFVRLA